MTSGELDYSPFDGDGRRRVTATETMRLLHPEWHCQGITTASARKLIDAFAKTGWSRHNASGDTCWVIQAWCRRHSIEIRWIKHPVGGWAAKYEVEEDEAAY